MRNLPNLDGFGLAGLTTDPYIKVSIGDNTRRSGTILNNLNPVWPPCKDKGCKGTNDIVRDLNFGFRPAGTEIVILAYDDDGGLEFGDDLIAQVTVNAIYCSAYSAIAQPIISDDDSAWKMPKQPLCVEEIWIPLVADGVCVVNGVVSTSVPCMRLRMTALPFQMRVEEVFLTSVLVNGGMGGYFPDEDSLLYGRVYSSSNTRMLSYYRMDRSAGGLLIRSQSTTHNNKGNASLAHIYGYAPYARVTINYPAELFVFRRVDDEATEPEWLNTTFGWAETREYAQLMDTTGDFRAVAKNFSAYSINKYGDAGGIGIITGGNLAQNATETRSMYFVIASPHESYDVVTTVYSKAFSSVAFINISLQFGPTFVFLIGMVIMYMKKMNWRLERVQSYLAEKVMDDTLTAIVAKPGNPTVSSSSASKKPVAATAKVKEPPSKSGAKQVQPDIVALLFLCCNESPNNVEFRRNLFYATCALYAAMVSPLLVLIAWGVTSILLVTPPAFGFALIFIGLSAILTYYGAIRWIQMGWRMTDTILRLFGLSFLFAFVFLFAATFADPRVLVGKEHLSFFSLTAIFLTLNMMPLIWIVFTNDSKLMKSLSQVIATVAAAKKVNVLKNKFKNLGSLGLKLASANEHDQQKRAHKESAFAPVMGDHYSVEKSITGFNRADILQSAFVTSPATRQANNCKYFLYSLLILVIYALVAIVRTSYPSQSIGIAFTVILVDSCIYMMYRGYLAWSPGYIVFLMSSVRVCIAATCGEYWILGHAFLYMVFGTALCREIIGKNLPRMSQQEAGGVAFFGHDHQQWRHFDVSTTPEFALGLLSFFYVFLLLAVAFGTNANQTITVAIMGQQWQLWVFGVLAFIVVLFIGLALATSRAFFLQAEQLLSEFALQMYLFVRPFKLPFILAAASEVLVICSGLFVFAATKSTFILVFSIFAPLIMMLSMAVYTQWKRNDHRLVIWPPEDDEEDILDDDDFDEEAEMEKEAELMRNTFVLPPLKGKGNMSIYDSGDETFKMPSLPPKTKLLSLTKSSTLQGSKPKAPIPLFGRKRERYSQQSHAKSGQAHDSPVPRSGSLDLTVVPISEDGNSLPSAASPLPVKSSKSSRFLLLRDLFARRIGFRALLSRNTWRKYQEVRNMGPSSSSLIAGETSSPRGGTTRLLLKQAGSSRRRSSLYSSDGDVDFEKMTLYQAFQQGFLLPQDYTTVGCFVTLLVLVFIFGMIISATETPGWMGYLIWVGFYVLMFTLSPVVKYFNIASQTNEMTYCLGASFFLAWVAGLILFVQVLKCNVNMVESLVILSVLVFYPIFSLLIVTLVKWKDDNWEITRPLRRTVSFCLAFVILWIFEIYVWVSASFGAILTFLLCLFAFIAFFLLKWVENDRYLAPVYQRRANLTILFATFSAIIVGLIAGLNYFYCLSIAFLVLILKYSMLFVATWFVGKEDVVIFYSPYIFPVFSYNAYTNNVIDENQSMRYLLTTFLLVFLWGASGVVFFDPLAFGIGLCSVTLLAFAGVTAHLCAVTPVKMGIAAKYVNEMIIKDASAASKDVSDERRRPFTLECKEFVELERRERKAELEFQAIALGGAFAKKKKFAIEPEKNKKAQEDDAEAGKEPEPRRTAGDIAMEIEAMENKSRLGMEDGVETQLIDGLYTWKEIVHEVFHLGIGPFGFLMGFTLAWKLAKYLKTRYCVSRTKRRAAKANEIDALEKGELVVATSKRDPTDLVGNLLELPVLDEQLDLAFFEETRCIIHFQLLLMNASDARLGREKILFQKFLRENRFKLMSNGINPPANIFKTSSFASIDIPLVAVWLISLTPEERARFHALKAAFNEEMERTDAIIDAEDQQTRATQLEFREYWMQHEEAQCRRRMQEFQARRMRREAEGILLEERGAHDEDVQNAQEAIMEIESGYSCVPGDLGRSLQFVDREFPPDQTAIANCTNEAEITGWAVSTAINLVAGLFDGGTDPDDVNIGRLNDSWLLSAISIIAASGGVDDGKVDALIDKIFITKQTSLTGAYAMRIYKNCQWETVIVDDFFPMLADSFKTTESAGAAFAHSKDFEELWVPLLEKAFAKYYGGYAALEQGYVHHALKELTSYESEEIFLAQASRGTLKTTLWKQLLIYRSNKFLMGAGTIMSENADTEILDTGLVFGACYVIYDVQEIDGHRLLLLRNPPGDHDEWKGDWSDHSRLWTRRLKKLLHWNPNSEDNTFWMSFDDFCHVFRSLYVCRYYDPVKWPIQIRHGRWQGETACGLPTQHNPNCELDGNPQYSLSVPRPAEVMITVTQVDPAGLAPVDVLPIAVYIVAQGSHKDRASRVKQLNKHQVVAHSGEPVRQREVHVHCSLEGRTYTVLVAAYKKGMEGPFKLTVQSNYPLEIEQLWPAVWKDPAKATMAEKMATKVKETVAESSAMVKIREKTDEIVSKIAAGAAVVDHVMRDDTAVLKEQLEKQEQEQADAQAKASGKGAAAKKPQHAWIEQWDESAGKPFYFNKQTGMSSWTKPEDF